MSLLPKTAIICYDLKNVKPGDNQNVKRALTQFDDTITTFKGLENSLFPRLVNLRLPDTTLLCSTKNSTISAKQIAENVAEVIRQQNAEVGKIYVTFLSIMSDYYLINE